MKRANDTADEESESSGLKKARLFNGYESERTDSGKVDEGIFGGLFSDDLEGHVLGGSNKWDFDINFDLIYCEEEVRKNGLAFDVVNLPAVHGSRVDVIDIESGDSGSDSEVELIGHGCGYNDGVENLSLGLGMAGMSNFVEITREEKGKANVGDSWLSNRSNNPIGLHLLTSCDDLIGPSGPREVVLVRSEMAERALRQAEETLRYRENAYRESGKEIAKRLARTNFQDKKQLPVEQLGNRLGPFSEALRMVRERTSKRGSVIEWKPSMGIQDRSIIAPFVPSLLDLSLKALAENAERMVSLKLVPDNLRERLSDRLCDISKMNVRVMNLLVEGCPTEIRIKNCSWLTDQQFQKMFENCRTKNLRVLQLDLCGQCMLDFAFKDILSHSPNSFSSLAIVSLRGACRLSDSGLKSLLMSARSVRSINLGHCNLLTSNAISFIADSLGSNLRELFIDDCQKINPMLIVPALHKFPYLELLSVAGIRSITDQFISEVVTACGQSIKELNLADCIKLTDCSMEVIGSSCAGLSSLNISNLPNLTDLGMEYISNGCRSIRKLKLCRNEFSDEAIAAYIECSGEYLTELLLNHMTKVGLNTSISLAKRSRKLSSLDISWCRRITNEALGLIVDSCLSLKLLKVFGCRQITDVFLNGHSNPGVRFIGLNFTRILDHVSLLEPEGVLLRYSPLPN